MDLLQETACNPTGSHRFCHSAWLGTLLPPCSIPIHTVSRSSRQATKGSLLWAPFYCTDGTELKKSSVQKKQHQQFSSLKFEQCSGRFHYQPTWLIFTLIKHELCSWMNSSRFRWNLTLTAVSLCSGTSRHRQQNMTRSISDQMEVWDTLNFLHNKIWRSNWAQLLYFNFFTT